VTASGSPSVSWTCEPREEPAISFREVEPNVWQLDPTGPMRVPGRIFASRELIDALDEKVTEQVANVAALPGIVGASFAMPDAHWGYGFPIGGVAAFDPDRGGIVSAGGVGFDISCGVRTFTTGLKAVDLGDHLETIAHDLYRTVPAGVGWGGAVKLTLAELDEALTGGAAWAVENGWGEPDDLERIEERGRMEGADPSRVSRRAKERQLSEIGSLGSGNHYLELQVVERCGSTNDLALKADSAILVAAEEQTAGRGRRGRGRRGRRAGRRRSGQKIST